MRTNSLDSRLGNSPPIYKVRAEAAKPTPDTRISMTYCDERQTSTKDDRDLRSFRRGGLSFRTARPKDRPAWTKDSHARTSFRRGRLSFRSSRPNVFFECLSS